MEAEKTLIIWDRIGDYHRARLRALESVLGPENVFAADLGKADGLYKWDSSRNSERHFLLSEKKVDQGDLVRRTLRFISIVKGHNIRRIGIAGYGRKEYIFFILISNFFRRKVVLFAESWYGRNPVKNFLKGLFLRMFCKGFFLSGELARDHFINRLGIPSQRIATGYSAVDNRHFRTSCLPDRPEVILCVARFSPEKNLSMLVSAFLKSTARKRFCLRIIGGGPEMEALMELSRGCQEIELLDWIGYAEMPTQYAQARYFVLPSNFEPWGLVVNEAMAAGLPILISRACGCLPDLLKSGNGFSFEPENEDDLRRILDRVVEIDEASWTRMSELSRNIVARYGCREWAASLVRIFG